MFSLRKEGRETCSLVYSRDLLGVDAKSTRPQKGRFPSTTLSNVTTLVIMLGKHHEETCNKLFSECRERCLTATIKAGKMRVPSFKTQNLREPWWREPDQTVALTVGSVNGARPLLTTSTRCQRRPSTLTPFPRAAQQMVNFLILLPLLLPSFCGPCLCVCACVRVCVCVCVCTRIYVTL